MTVTTNTAETKTETETYEVCIDNILEDLGFALGSSVYVTLSVQYIKTPHEWTWECPNRISTKVDVIDVENL